MDLTTPGITLTNPQPGSKVSGVIKLEATASDNVGIDHVDMLIDGKLAAVEKLAPFSAIFDSKKLSDGPHKFSAVAYDAAGNKAATIEIDFTVDNSVVVVPPPAGWTWFPAPAQSVFVSASQGSDSNDGLSAAKPVKTLAKGYAVLKPGNSALLLKSGDLWREAFPYWNKSGISADAPILIGSYGGAERPIVSAVSDENILVTRSKVDFVAVVGIQFTNLTRNPKSLFWKPKTSSDAGLRWQSTGQFLLIEDCMFDFHRVGIVCEQSDFKDLRIRRCVIANNYADNLNGPNGDGHSQGIYLEAVHGLLFEENVLDANGYLLSLPGGGGTPTIFNHNFYNQVETDGAGTVIRGNIFSRASATGIQMRGGGLCEGNFFVQNPISMTMGAVNGGHAPLKGGVVGEIRNNVFLEGTDISPNLPRGGAMNLGNTKNVSVHNNIFSHCISPKRYHGAIEFDCANGDGLQALTIKDNIMWKWTAAGATSPIVFNSSCGAKAVLINNLTTGNFPKPDQDLSSYDPDFFEGARRQSRFTWNEKFTAAAALKYFRAGFGQ